MFIGVAKKALRLWCEGPSWKERKKKKKTVRDRDYAALVLDE
jgi:hypothetical protein